MSIPELSRIYPTPPSVETIMEVDKFDEAKEERTDGITMVTSTAAPLWDTALVGYIYSMYMCKCMVSVL